MPKIWIHYRCLLPQLKGFFIHSLPSNIEVTLVATPSGIELNIKIILNLSHVNKNILFNKFSYVKYDFSLHIHSIKGCAH